jgi:hypothetical protein
MQAHIIRPSNFPKTHVKSLAAHKVCHRADHPISKAREISAEYPSNSEFFIFSLSEMANYLRPTVYAPEPTIRHTQPSLMAASFAIGRGMWKRKNHHHRN